MKKRKLFQENIGFKALNEMYRNNLEYKKMAKKLYTINRK